MIKSPSILLVSIVVLAWPQGRLAAQVKPPLPAANLRVQPALRLSVHTPLGEDVFLLEEFLGEESLSTLFSFKLGMFAESDQAVQFETLLGKDVLVTVSLPDGTTGRFGGMCNRFSQGDRRSGRTLYRAQIVPRAWLLTLGRDSRIFHELSVPEILRLVLDGVPGLSYELRLEGTYHPRNQVVQYRESDFQFASRLMEEEGIFFFFQHSAAGHTMVIANTPQSHPDQPGGLAYDPLAVLPGRLGGIHQWEKTQALRAGKYALRDHHFELPGNSLEATATIQESVQAGLVVHRLALPETNQFEVYDYPGEYAERFDGVDPAGGERPEELRKIAEDARRTVEIRMQEEAAQALVVRGSSTAPQLASGHKFALREHFNADGSYVVTSVRHTASATPGSGGGVYHNSFTCIPAALPFRPARTTPKPTIPGTQTGFVVGPPGQEIFTDKYGRVKVQFHWDREGRGDDTSSAWVRVAALNAGTELGFIHIPRIGTEVVVAFQDGDPDRPLITGSVYNAQHLPVPRGDPPPEER